MQKISLIIILMSFVSWLIFESKSHILNNDEAIIIRDNLITPLSTTTILNQKEYQSNFSNEITGYFVAIDGDSLRKDDINIRLINIDAPEYKQTCYDENSKKYDCGIISKNFLKNLIKNQKLICKYNKKDIYDRFLATCYKGKININEEMIKNGMAMIYNIHNSSKKIKILQELAKKRKIGIWKGEFISPKNYRKLSNLHLK